MIATDKDMDACKKALIDAGADPNLENKVGCGVLSGFAPKNQISSTRLFLSFYAIECTRPIRLTYVS